MILLVVYTWIKRGLSNYKLYSIIFINILLFFIPFAKGENLTDFSINLKQAPLVPTLQYLAMKEKINLIVDNKVKEDVTLTLYNTDFSQLLKASAQIQQLNQWKKNNIYYLTSHKNLNDNSLAENKNLPLVSIKLNYAKVNDVLKVLTTGSGSFLSNKGGISADERSNTLLIKESYEQIANIKKIVKKLDQPIQQIAIEARIVTMNEQSLKELGVRWGLFTPSNQHYKFAGSLDANHFADIGKQLNVNFATTNANVSAAFQIAKINGRLLDLELNALEQENAVEIIASPKLLTTNKKSASIKQGTELPYVLTNEKNGTQEVQFKEAVLGLEVTPHITKDNKILLDLVVTQNAPGASVSYGKGEVVAIEKQEINTQVFATTGETIVLGGIFHDTVSQSVDKVPLLGDIPLMKHLFQRKGERHQKRELVIFVTPHIIKGGESSPYKQQRKLQLNLQQNFKNTKKI